MNYYEVLDTVAQFKEQICLAFEDVNLPGGNFINQNYCQGIILEEGCSASIINNTISGNLKANIALGGVGSNSEIKKNFIDKGKREGIFVVEGEENLVIESNYIDSNETGIVLLHSDGNIDSNIIKENETGISIVSDTIARLEKNRFEKNSKGIEIKDPANPDLKRNMFKDNSFHLKVDPLVYSKRWNQYVDSNPEVLNGDNDTPQ